MIDFGYQWFKLKLKLYYEPIHWWHEKLPWWIALRIPPKIALFTYIRVYGILGECGPEYRLVHDLWEHKYGLRGKKKDARKISVSDSKREHTGKRNIQEEGNYSQGTDRANQSQLPRE